MLSDTLCDGHTERRQIAGDGMHAFKAVGILNCSGNTDCTAFEAVLQHLDDIGVVLLAQQQPRLQPFPNGDDAQRLEKSAPLQFVQNIVLKLRDERHSRFPVQRFKQRLPVSGRAKKDALSRRQLYIRLPVRLCIFVLFCRSVRIVQREDGRLGVNSVVAQMAFVFLGFAGEHGCFTGKFRFQRRTGVDRVRHGANHLRVPAEADRQKTLLTPIRFKNDRVRIRAKTDRLFGIVIADWHEPAFLWHSWFHSLLRFGRKKTATAIRQLRSLASFCILVFLGPACEAGHTLPQVFTSALHLLRPDAALT